MEGGRIFAGEMAGVVETADRSGALTRDIVIRAQRIGALVTWSR
jgi:hypothetical protein